MNCLPQAHIRGAEPISLCAVIGATVARACQIATSGKDASPVTAKADYTDAEWKLLLSAMAMVGFSMMAVSRSGTIGKLWELAMLHDCLLPDRVPAQFRHNELVMALVRDFHSPAPATIAPMDTIEQTPATSGAAAAPRTAIACCELVAQILASKTPVLEADGYKRWLMWIARSVAEAPGQGLLHHRRAMSREEEELLQMISTALHVSLFPPVPTASDLDHWLTP